MPHNRGVVRLDTWLSALLWAIAKKAGGEIRLSGYDLDDVPEQCAVTTDYDPVDHCFVIRPQSGAAEMIIINKGQQWAQSKVVEPNSQPSREPSPPQQSQPQRKVVLDDETMAEMEQRLLRRAANRRAEQEAEAVRTRREES